MSLNRKVIKDFESVDRLRELLYYEFRISNTSYLIFLFFGLLVPRLGYGILLIKIILLVFIAAAVIFTPYIFYVLIKEERYGWLVTYLVMIPFPLITGYFIFKDTLAFEAVLLIPLLSFYLYCYLLKYAVDDWIRQYNWVQQLMHQKEERIKRIEDERPWI
jgi:hypothetical protein